MNQLPLQRATYRAIADSFGFGKTTTDKDQIGVKFLISDGEHAGNEIWWYGYFTDAAFEMTHKALRSMGFKGADLEALTLESIQQPVDLVCDVEEYKGTKSLKVKFVNSLGGGGLVTQLDANAKKTLSERMKGKFLIADQNAGKPAPAKPAPRRPVDDFGPPPPDFGEPPPHTDDDIPF